MKILFENWRRYLTEANNPLERLRNHLISLHALYEAEDYDELMKIMDSPAELQKMMQMMGDADEFLTGKRFSQHQYENGARAVLQAENEVMHLADGGYSRLTVSYSQPPHLWMDESLSSQKVAKKWRKYLNLDDELPDGEQDYQVGVDDLKKSGTILKDEDFAQSLRDQYNIELNLSKPIDEELVSIELIKVPEGSRGQGIGTEVMKKIIEWADSNKYLLSVEPSSDFGTPKKDLIRFYKELGFVPNRGRNKDYRTRDTMIRNPR